MKKKLKFLVAQHENGMFFGLDEDYSTTSDKQVEHPYDAKKIFPYSEFGFQVMKEPEWYFENSYRMKNWLKGCKMVTVEMEVDYKILINA